jgi:hypothetical protein
MDGTYTSARFGGFVGAFSLLGCGTGGTGRKGVYQFRLREIPKRLAIVVVCLGLQRGLDDGRALPERVGEETEAVGGARAG